MTHLFHQRQDKCKRRHPAGAVTQRNCSFQQGSTPETNRNMAHLLDKRQDERERRQPHGGGSQGLHRVRHLTGSEQIEHVAHLLHQRQDEGERRQPYGGGYKAEDLLRRGVRRWREILSEQQQPHLREARGGIGKAYTAARPGFWQMRILSEQAERLSQHVEAAC